MDIDEFHDLYHQRVKAIKEFGLTHPDGFTNHQAIAKHPDIFGSLSIFRHFMLKMSHRDQKLSFTISNHQRTYCYGENLFNKLHRLWDTQANIHNRGLSRSQ